MDIGFGFAAGTTTSDARALSALAARHRISSVWSRDAPGDDGLALLASTFEGAPSVHEFGVGVIAIDRNDVKTIVGRLERTPPGLRDKLILGIGAGNPGEHPVQRMEAAVLSLRTAVPSLKLAVAALRPRMCHLAGRLADAVIFNWITPDTARLSRNLVEEGAREAGRPTPLICAYIRCATDPSSLALAQKEAATYASYPAYQSYIRMQGVEPELLIEQSSPDTTLRTALARYDALDLAIARAPAGASSAMMAQIIESLRAV